MSGFDATTSEILEWELEAIFEALLERRVEIHVHAQQAADDEGIPQVALLEAIVVGTPVSKDLPGNDLNRQVGINFEHRLTDGRWIRVKVTWFGRYAVVTVHTL